MHRITVLILATLLLAGPASSLNAKPHACTRYANLVCKICGPNTKACTDTKARWKACMQSRSCDKSICADSLNSAAALDESVLRSMLCAVEPEPDSSTETEPAPEPESDAEPEPESEAEPEMPDLPDAPPAPQG